MRMMNGYSRDRLLAACAGLGVAGIAYAAIWGAYAAFDNEQLKQDKNCADALPAVYTTVTDMPDKCAGFDEIQTGEQLITNDEGVETPTTVYYLPSSEEFLTMRTIDGNDYGDDITKIGVALGAGVVGRAIVASVLRDKSGYVEEFSPWVNHR